MAFEIRYYMLIHNKDDKQFVTEFPCFLGHPVAYTTKILVTLLKAKNGPRRCPTLHMEPPAPSTISFNKV